MDSKITPPIYVFDDADLTIFTCEQELIYDLGLELQDIKRGVYHCYDSNGYEVFLKIINHGKKELLVLEQGNHEYEHFRCELIDRLQRVKESVDLDIDDTILQNRIQQKYGVIG